MGRAGHDLGSRLVRVKKRRIMMFNECQFTQEYQFTNLKIRL